MDNGRKHATIEAGGKIYNLSLSFNAMVAFHENVGPIAEHVGKGGLSFPGCRGVIWSGINEYGAQQITLEEAGDICEQYLDEHGYLSLVEKLMKFLDSAEWYSKGVKKSDAGKNPKAPAPKV